MTYSFNILNWFRTEPRKVKPRVEKQFGVWFVSIGGTAVRWFTHWHDAIDYALLSR